MKWFRFYHEARTDKKLDSLTDAQFRVWINLLCYAAEQEERGRIEVDSEFLLAVECARSDEDLLRETLDALSKLGIVERDDDDLTFINWSKRQYDSDNSTERVRAFRERQRNDTNKEGNVTETFQEQADNVSPSVNTDTDSETDTELKTGTNVPAGADAPPNAHYLLYEYICELNGSDPKDNPKPDKQLKVCGRLIESYGYELACDCAYDMAGDDFWRQKGFDAFNVEKQIDKFIMRGGARETNGHSSREPPETHVHLTPEMRERLQQATGDAS